MIDWSDSRVWFTAVVAVTGVMRLVELAVSSRNIARLRARGAVEVGRSHYPWMVAVHAAFPIACLAEVWLVGRPFFPLLASFALGALVGAAALRWWVVATLGERWTTRIFVLPGAQLVDRGPFRRLRHPNYLAVVVEFVALPMIHSAWLTAIVFSVLNALVLRRRIRIEEAALTEHGGDRSVMGDRPRFVPGAE
jgi:methyltransferase